MRGRPEIRVKASDRAAIVGKTGSGKTYLARRLCAGISRLVVIDHKSSLVDWHTVPATSSAWSTLDRGEPVRIRVVYEDDTTYEVAIARALAARDCTIYIDEVYGITEIGKRPRALVAALTRGREFGVGVWVSTQRPTNLPLFVLSEADHYFVFRLNLEEDKKRLAAFAGEEVLTTIEDQHGFYYARAGETPRYFTRL